MTGRASPTRTLRRRPVTRCMWAGCTTCPKQLTSHFTMEGCAFGTRRRCFQNGCKVVIICHGCGAGCIRTSTKGIGRIVARVADEKAKRNTPLGLHLAACTAGFTWKFIGGRSSVSGRRPATAAKGMLSMLEWRNLVGGAIKWRPRKRRT